MNLDQIARKNNTDKASCWINENGNEARGHDYARFYEFYFKDRREQEFSLLELGCGADWNLGASIRTWEEYFPKAKIYGCDINANARKLENDRVEIRIGDLGDVEFLRTLSDIEPEILIDDASHFWDHQVLAFIELFDSVKPGGLYVLEDFNTSFGKWVDRYSNGFQYSAFQFLIDLCTYKQERSTSILNRLPYPAHVKHLERSIDFMSFYTHTAVIKKA